MANPSKKKGTKAETEVVNFLADYGIVAERMALSGAKDKGDIKVIESNYGKPLVFEVKAGKQTQNPSRSDIEDWLAQARVEGENSGCDCMLVIRRYKRNIADAEVWHLSHHKLTFMWLDDWCERYGKCI